MPRFNVGDKVRYCGREWTIVSDHASFIGRTMTPEMADLRVNYGLEHLPNGRAVYFDDEDMKALEASAFTTNSSDADHDRAERIAQIIVRAKEDDAHEGLTRSAEERVSATSPTSSTGAQ
jgi:hypothetical protein